MFKKGISYTFISLFLLAFDVTVITAQTAPSLIIKSPLKEQNVVRSKKNFITGITCIRCAVAINDKAVKVYNTGTFAFEVNLPGDSIFIITATAPDGKKISKQVIFQYSPVTDTPVTTLSIPDIKTYPEGDLILRSGDKIRIRVKALPGGTVTSYKSVQLFELPVSMTGGIAGIYQGEYIIKPADNFSGIKFPVTLITDSGSVTKESSNRFSVMSSLASDIAITKGRLAHLEYGLGDDRLGGAKIGYLDSLVLLKITGKVGRDYRIELASNRTAYIEEDLVTPAPKGTFAGYSLTSNWSVYGDSLYDYVQVSLTARLPYQSMQLLDPTGLQIDIFGAVNNTNWITQMASAKSISNLGYEQIADDILRIKIKLNEKQHWGHHIYYKGNNLVIRIKRKPLKIDLRNLTIAVDAGHGGSNTGAQGLTGAIEKDLALAVSLKVQKLLQQEGAKVIMTRTVEKFFDNKERILFYRDSLPDLLISIHLNSSADPVNTGGTMMFYRYPGYRKLSEAIYNRMLELGLKPGGITGSFNFMLNSPTEYPNALVEALFLSNPEEEAKIVDPAFQQQMAEKIVLGIKDFLSETVK